MIKKTITFFLSLCCLLGTNAILQAQTVGLLQNSMEALNGYTLFSPNGSDNAYLIDNCGYSVNTWETGERPGLSAYLLNNGDLLRTVRENSGTFNGGGIGGGIERYDWAGNLVWEYDLSDNMQHQHHDIEPMPNGNILAILWEYKTDDEAIAMGRNPNLTGNSVWPDKIVEIAPNETGGTVVWAWHFWDHLIQDYDADLPNYGVVADHPELLNINYGATGGGGGPGGGGGSDWIHSNGIDYNPTLDQIAISSRHLNEVYIIDHSTTTEEAASHTGGTYGKGGDFLFRWGNPQAYDRGTAIDQKLFGQHDVRWIEANRPDAGSLMVFNNGDNRPTGDFSSVDVITPPVNQEGHYFIADSLAFGPTALTWVYANPGTFFSSRISGAERLPNGNTLICEGTEGRFFEVDYDGNIVWEYINPITAFGSTSQGNNPNNNESFRATRYAEDFEGFEGKDLTPSNPLELNPDDYDCSIFFTEVVSIADDQNQEKVALNIAPNPIMDYLQLQKQTADTYTVLIYDANGQMIQQQMLNRHSLTISTTDWHSGLYMIRVRNKNAGNTTTYKIIKL